MVGMLPTPVPMYTWAAVPSDWSSSLQPRILFQRLDKSPNGVQRGGVHLVDQAGVPVRREPRVDPFPVIPEIEIGLADQEVVRAEPVERRQPAFRLFQVAGKGFHVGRAGRHDAPAEYTDSAQ